MENDLNAVEGGSQVSRPASTGTTRRELLGGSAAALSGWLMAPSLLGLARPVAASESSPKSPPEAGDDRLARAYELRVKAAQHARELGAATHPTNGDEALPGHLATFTKGLPHDALCLVDPKAYAVLARALATGDPHAFESIPLGGFVKLANPQASWAYDLVGVDASQLGMPPPPRFSSADLLDLLEQTLLAEEVVEVAGHVLL